jgi:Glycosyl transferase family 2
MTSDALMIEAPETELVVRNAVARPLPPLVTIATPFFRDDPTPLIAALAVEAGNLPVELIAVDDGTGDGGLSGRVRAAIEAFRAPAQLVTFTRNQGRSAARNRLIAGARAGYVLFLDSDMLPDRPDFLSAWLAHVQAHQPSVTYGGYTTLHAPDGPEVALARALAQSGDCASAQERSARGAAAVATSNLMVRADVLGRVPFDGGFRGWGWEDVDWALRAAAAGYIVTHADIPATHLGLDSDAVLLDKYAKAGPNFALMLANHPELEALPAAKAARLLSRVPGQGLGRGIWRALACAPFVPIKARILASRLWRASWAASALKG